MNSGVLFLVLFNPWGDFFLAVLWGTSNLTNPKSPVCFESTSVRPSHTATFLRGFGESIGEKLDVNEDRFRLDVLGENVAPETGRYAPTTSMASLPRKDVKLGFGGSGAMDTS